MTNPNEMIRTASALFLASLQGADPPPPIPDAPSEARTWHKLTTGMLPPGEKLVRHRWAWRLLEQGAVRSETPGHCGRMYYFQDGSWLCANDDGAWIGERAK